MCLLVSFAGIMPVRSQEKTKMVTVEGTVVDETETPVIGANVYIKGSTKGVSTNVDGNFIFTGVPVGQMNCTPKVGQVKHYPVIERVRYCTGLFPFNRALILLLL